MRTPFKRAALWLSLACGLWLAGACSSSEGRLTQVLIALDAEDEVAQNLSRVELETYSLTGELVDSLSYTLGADEPGADSVSFPFSVGVVKRASDRFLLVVTGYADGEPVIERKAIVTFVPGQIRALGIVLQSPCFGKLCGEPGSAARLILTCRVNDARGAQCESVALEETVSVAVGSELDAGLGEAQEEDASEAPSQDEPAAPSCEGDTCIAECSAGALRCADEQRLQRCDERGRWQAEQLCVNGCRPGTTECSSCAPGARRCDKRQPQVCRQDGSAWVDNGALCDTECVDGNCPTCAPGAAPRCRGQIVEECAANKSWQTKKDCAPPTPLCVQGECRTCEPGATVCMGTTRQICDANGAGWAKQSVSKDVCGAECDPGQKRCFAQVVQRCDATGDWSDPAVTVGECEVVCKAGEQSCAGSEPRTCNDMGTAWIKQPVRKGTCGAECDPGTSECEGAQTRSCNAAGRWSALAYAPPSCGAVCVPGNVRCSNTTPQGCSPDGRSWRDQPPQSGTCDCNKPAPAGFGGSCGSCGGTVQCDGSCSVATPSTFGQSCGSCGGTVQCDGSCSVATPSTFGQSCGSCGGGLRCDGTCSVATPSTFGQSCGSCGGTVQCDGTCSVSTPSNLGQSCGSCGGTVRCDGTCSAATPPDLGQSCGSCGGVRLCNGGCSTPPDPRPCSAGRCCETDDCGRCIYCAAAKFACP